MLESRKEIPHGLIEKIDGFLNAPIFKPFAVIDVLVKLDQNWADKKGQSLEEIEELRKILLNVYSLNNGRFIMKLADKFNKDPIWVAIRYLIFFGGFFVLGFFSFWFFSQSWVPLWVESWRGFVGAVLGASAIFAKLGWNSWGRNTLPEKLDRWFFRIFSGISFFFLSRVSL